MDISYVAVRIPITVFRLKFSHHLRWLKETRLEDDSLSHLKRVRKLGGHTTFLICESSIPLPTFPLELEGLHDPYQLEVPMSSALTPMSLVLKASLWPTLYTPRRKGELESWSKAKVRWAEKAVRRIVDEALDALDRGEVNMISFFFCYLFHLTFFLPAPNRSICPTVP
jgi:tRNA-specific adenosine deaminase 3